LFLLLWFTASRYPFGIFKLLSYIYSTNFWHQTVAYY
jgi:hypothetical protein